MGEPALTGDACPWARISAAVALEEAAVGDPMGCGVHVADVLERFLFVQEDTLRRTGRLAGGSRLMSACRTALGRCQLTLAFVGWKQQLSKTSSSRQGSAANQPA